MRMAGNSDYGAFMEKFILSPSPTAHLPLSQLTFAVKDIFDVDGYVTGFGNPDWLKTHSAATSTAPAVLALLMAGAKCVGKTVLDEMAYSTNGENIHYGTPLNPCAHDREKHENMCCFKHHEPSPLTASNYHHRTITMVEKVPGGSSGGSAVAVAAMLVDFSLGWFARDPRTLNRVGRILLQSPNEKLVHLSQVLIAEDCFKLLSIPATRVTKVIATSFKKLFGDDILQSISLGDYIESKVPSLKYFMKNNTENEEFSFKSLVAVSTAMRLLVRSEFKKNHSEWVRTVKPNFGPGISERVLNALKSSEEHIDACESVKTQLREALTALLGENGVIVIPTLLGPPPKLQTETTSLKTFRTMAFHLLSVAGVSGFCELTVPLGKYDGLPVSVSLLAKHGSDGFLLNLVETLYDTIKEQVGIVEKS